MFKKIAYASVFTLMIPSFVGATQWSYQENMDPMLEKKESIATAKSENGNGLFVECVLDDRGNKMFGFGLYTPEWDYVTTTQDAMIRFDEEKPNIFVFSVIDASILYYGDANGQKTEGIEKKLLNSEELRYRVGGDDRTFDSFDLEDGHNSMESVINHCK